MKEMDKMFESRDAHISIQQMHDFGITQLCIKPPQEIEKFRDEQLIQTEFLSKSLHICNVLGLLINTLKHERDPLSGDSNIFGFTFKKADLNNPEFRLMQKCAFYAGLLLPFNGYEYTNSKKKPVTAVQHILLESLKQSNDVQKNVTLSLQYLQKEMAMLCQKYSLDSVTAEELSSEQKLEIALALRQIGPYYGQISLLKIAEDYVSRIQPTL
mmetsp:Transcript_17443/g.29349  ORF Transcript_17443/g.29349 Transcript_17443/m.29349 type:complete len:213 (+) Transcript_17443:833-1471(+)